MIPRVLVNGLLQADWFEPIAVHVNGLPFTSEGSLAVAIDATVDHVHNGIPFDADGRVCVEEGSAAYHLAGRAYTASNRLLVDIFGTQASALAGLPLTSAGALAVEMFASATFALDFARDQYSTLSPALTVSSPTGGVMVPDYLGNYHTALAGEIPIKGGRRKRQLISKTEDFSHAGWIAYNTASKVGATTVAGVPVVEVAFGSTGGTVSNASALYMVLDTTRDGIARKGAFWVRAKSGSTTVRVSLTSGTTAGTDDVTVSDAEWTRIAYKKADVGSGVGTNIALRNNVAGNSGNVYVAIATCYTGEHQDDLPDVYTSDTIEEPEYVSRGVLSSPYHGYGVDGLAWMRTDPSGLALADGIGPELVTNGGFDTDTAWSKGTGFTISGGVLAKAAGSGTSATQNIGASTGKTYRVTGTAVRNAGFCFVRIGSLSDNSNAITTTGDFSFDVTCGSTSALLYFFCDASFIGSFDNISVREVYPVPCTGIADWPQITNLATYSCDFASGTWGTVGTATKSTPEDGPIVGKQAVPFVCLVDADRAEGTINGLTTSATYTVSFLVKSSIPTTVRVGGIASGIPPTTVAIGTEYQWVSATEVASGTTRYPQIRATEACTLTIAACQVEPGASRNPLVITEGLAVTADAIVKTLDDSLIGWVAGGGTMIVEQTPEQDASTGDILVDIKTDADNRILVSGAGGNTQLLVRDGASDVATINGTGWQAGVTQRVAAKIEANDAELVIDGSSEGTDTSLTVPAITTITLGGGQAKSIGAIAYYAAGA